MICYKNLFQFFKYTKSKIKIISYFLNKLIYLLLLYIFIINLSYITRGVTLLQWIRRGESVVCWGEEDREERSKREKRKGRPQRIFLT